MNEHLTVVITKDQVQGYGQTNSETKPRSTLSAVSGSKLDAIDFTIFEVFFGDSCFIKNVRDRRTWLKKESCTTNHAITLSIQRPDKEVAISENQAEASICMSGL
ncbi:hypothetical protein NC652_021246 [Populus alba x Populus x berolinensis]|nr:hypothetical protein NC652_021246 [Populus alba x Populus x berolinensis]